MNEYGKWLQIMWWGADWHAWSIGFDLCHDGLTLDLLVVSVTITLHWVLHAPIMNFLDARKLAKKKKQRSGGPNDLSWLDRETWATRAGNTLTPAEMDTGHLYNTLRMLERNAQKYRDAYVMQHYIFCPLQPSGDGAQMAFDREWASLMEQDPVQWLREQPIYKALAGELAGRDPASDTFDIRDTETPCGVDD